MNELVPNLDFARYAPASTALVWQDADLQPADDLARVFFAIGAGFLLIGRLMLIACRLACRRVLSWCRARISDLLGSLPAAWSIAGIGWGFGLGVFLLHYFAR